jgi:hypothetical protein
MGPYYQRTEAKRRTSRGPLAIWQKKERLSPVDPVNSYASPLVFRRAVDRSSPPDPDSAPVNSSSGEIATVAHEQPPAEPQRLAPDAGAQPLSPASVPPKSTP